MTHGPGPPARNLSPEARRRVLRRALLRPWALIVLVIGVVFFATSLEWWTLPLTLATYAALVVLAARDPIFQTLVLEGREKARAAARERARQAIGLAPEARVRRLPEGKTRSQAEAALEARERVLAAIKGSDEGTKDLFANTIPQLNRAADLLVGLAETREESANSQNTGVSKAIDAELSQAPERLHALRSEVVRASIESDDDARVRVDRVEGSLNDINRRLQELRANV